RSFQDYPWWKKHLHKREVMNVGAIEDMPISAKAEQTFLKQIGVKSQLLMPVYCGTDLMGFIGFDDVEQTITWRMIDIALIQIYADILSSALERRAMFESLRVSEEKFKNIFIRSSIGIGLTDSNGDLLEANAAMLEIYGFDTIEELNKNTHLRTLCADDFQRNQIKPGETFSCEKEFDFNLFQSMGKYSGKHRESRILHLLITPLYTLDHPKSLQFLMQVNDVTKQKRADEAIRIERDLLQALIDTIPDTVYFKDTESRFTRINPAQAHFLGLNDPKEAVGKTDFDYFSAKHAKETFSDERKMIETKQSSISKLEEIKQRDGSTIWLTATKVPLIDRQNQVTGIMGISRDVTDIMRAEEKLTNAAEALIKSNNELMQFAYVASHDLQEPLRTVASYIQLLQKRYHGKLDEDADTFINYAVDGVSRMQQLIKDLLLYSRVDSRGKPFEITDLNEVLDAVQMNMKFTIEDSEAQIIFEKLPLLYADSSQLLQLFQNLLSNAIKFKGDRKPSVHIQAKLNDGFWNISVKDNGIGIPSDQLENIFMIFKRLHTRDEYEGTGIGLAVCKKIVERHGGKIRVTSTEGKGSMFSFTIPEKGEMSL
ncbi:PAS domain S-box protein, partial [candidate division KSB1 bacterium]|nr:PAS domain S-box protein [candidate division KSB1 bacterium]